MSTKPSLFTDGGWVAKSINCLPLKHGIMGSLEPNYISRVRLHPDCKYTRSTTPRLQIRVIGCRVGVPWSHWSAFPTPLFIYISQLLRDSFSVSQQPPIWEPPSHYSMEVLVMCVRCRPYGPAAEAHLTIPPYNFQQSYNLSCHKLQLSDINS